MRANSESTPPTIGHTQTMPPAGGRWAPQATPTTDQRAANPTSASPHRTGGCNAHRWRHSSPAGHHSLVSSPATARRAGLTTGGCNDHQTVAPFLSPPTTTTSKALLPRGSTTTTCAERALPSSGKARSTSWTSGPAEPRSGPIRPRCAASCPDPGRRRQCSWCRSPSA